MNDRLLKLSRGIDRLSEFFGEIAKYIVIITLAIGFYNVVARYADRELGQYLGRNLSSNVFIELQWYLYSLVFLMGFAYIMKHEINVRVDFLYAKWPARKKALLDFWGHLLFLVPFCLLGIYVTISPVLRSWGLLPSGTWGTWELSPDPGGLPRAPLKTMIIVAFVLLLLQAISELIKLWQVIRGREEFLTLEKRDIDKPLRIE